MVLSNESRKLTINKNENSFVSKIFILSLEKNIINNNDEINKAHIGKYKLLIFNHSYLFFIISMFFFKNKIKTT